ncbi:hypothetical protein DDB_G0275477 [Dictyostelium discoideum AX4]|uniref:Uncharacterized protein n=1 Tax=Dictyostelium discoideum TaxID=44689 RepID=Q86IA7_DICDI|nr:hypothetical protein DDB_G0275477 [Dictyostelium discoideum AX4]EAL69489.1 hypothetical protein DDB_G0275477 [Dictyostelium discoideum AX4]|eukprot:XP_643626.1 hypothetical protein DDB_G0275477 [Dictyostelium discoideum AX4]
MLFKSIISLPSNNLECSSKIECENKTIKNSDINTKTSMRRIISFFTRPHFITY